MPPLPQVREVPGGGARVQHGLRSGVEEEDEGEEEVNTITLSPRDFARFEVGDISVFFI